MKVLMLCQRVAFHPRVEKSRKTTGYSYMVCDIIGALANCGIDIDVYAISDEHIKQYVGANVLSRNTWRIVRNIKAKYLAMGLKRIRKYHPGFRMSLTVMYYYAACGLVERYISGGNYDVIHIHGLGYGGRAYADCCEACGQRYIMTLHSMASFSARDVRKPGQIRNEEDYLHAFCGSNDLMTVISSKIKNDICDRYNGGSDMERISVVLNGMSGSTFEQDSGINIRSEYGIETRKRILLSVGNLSRRKNQAAIIRALSAMEEESIKTLCVLFLGIDFLDGELATLAEEMQVSQYVRFCGNIERCKLSSFYQQADLNLTVSVSEAFGMPVIEGFFYGLPSLMMADLEAKEDLFSPVAMTVVKERTDEALAVGIINALEKPWDRSAIRAYSARFTLEEAAKGYLETYQTF